MFKIKKKKIPKTVFLPEGIRRPELSANPNDYKLSYRVDGDSIIAEAIFPKLGIVCHYKYLGGKLDYWKLIGKHNITPTNV